MRRLRISFALAAVMALTLALPASAGAREKAPVVGYETGADTGGFVSIARQADGVDIDVHLRDLTPGNAITIWFVHFNECDGPCDPSDLGTNGNGAFWSKIGGVVNPAGNFNGNSYIAEGEEIDGPAPLVLTDAEGAEIHFVVQDHGPASGDAAILLAQTTTFEGGGCGDEVPPTAPPDTCVDVQVVGFFLP